MVSEQRERKHKPGSPNDMNLYVCCLLETRRVRVRATHTLTGYSSIFKVGAVVYTNWIRGAVHKSGFSPSASHLVQEDSSSSLAKEGPDTSNCTCNRCDASHIRHPNGTL